jgi:hypothetical protein
MEGLMKKMSIVGFLLLLSACSTHAVKCHGPLRPINEPTVSTPKVVTGSQPATNSLPGVAQKRGGSADPFRTEPKP